MGRFFLIQVVSWLTLSSVLCGHALSADWVIREDFGVSHPCQVVRLPSVGRVVGAVKNSDGAVAAAQTLADGRVAVRANLPAGKVEEWTIVGGGTPELKDSVMVRKEGDGVVLENGLVGVRLAGVAADGEAGPAFRAMRWGSGDWHEAIGGSLMAEGGEVTGATVEVRESGPLVGEVVVRYEVKRTSGENLGARAFYQCTVTMEAGEAVIGVEEESDIGIRSRWDIGGFVANEARYRGGSSTRPEHGRLADGSRYPPSHDRGGCDAFVDLRFDRDFESGFRMHFPEENTDEPGMLKRISGWDVAVVDGGWYWQVYDREGNLGSPLLGIFAGRASRLIKPGESGTGFHTRADDGTGGRVGLTTTLVLLPEQDGTTATNVRYAWNLFVGTKADLRPFDQFQKIGGLLDLHSGINLTKLASWKMDFPDPPGGYGALYLKPGAVASLRARMADPAARNGDEVYFDWIRRTEAASPELWELWHDPSPEAAQKAVDAVMADAFKLMDAFVNGDGLYQLGVHYWHGGLTMQRRGVIIDQLLADPRITGEARRKVKAAAAFFAHTLWDNDFVPMDNHRGINLGTPNMPVQQANYRHFYALLLASHPDFTARSQRVADEVRAIVRKTIHPDGAHMGCPHYIGASMMPTLNLVMRMDRLGLVSLVREEERLRKFGAFYLQLLTPPEPRFAGNTLTPPDERLGGKRSLLVLGDGPFEGSHLFGQMGTALAEVDPALSARLMQAWDETGKVHSNFFGTSVLAIDDDLPRAPIENRSARFDGYLTSLRSAFGTPDESVAWVVDGEHYFDHRHQSDRGSFSLYMLGVPVVTHWASFYTPRAWGSYFKPVVLYEDMVGQAWDADGRPPSTGSDWGRSRPDAWAEHPEWTMTGVHCERGETAWTRRVTLLHADPSRPVVVVEDALGGQESNMPMVASFPFEAGGPVETPVGSIEPPRRFHPRKEFSEATASTEFLPSATKLVSLPAGSHRFGFRGSFGVDFDVWVVSDTPIEFVLGHWEVDLGEARQSQQFLRIRNTGPLTTAIIPRRRGDSAPGDSVTGKPGNVLLRVAGGRYQWRDSGIEYACGGTKIFRPWKQ